MALTSTVPAAVSAVLGYLDNVAAANPALSLGVFPGYPTGGNLPANFVMLGQFTTGGANILEGLTHSWATLPAGGNVSEDYAINVSVVVWSGNQDPAARLSEAFTIYDALCQQTIDDLTAGGNLASGCWGDVTTTMPICGPFEDLDGNQAGWGVVLEVALHVENVLIHS